MVPANSPCSPTCLGERWLLSFERTKLTEGLGQTAASSGACLKSAAVLVPNSMKSPVDLLPEQLISSAPTGRPTLVKQGLLSAKYPGYCFHLRGQTQASFYLSLPLLIT